MSCKKKSRKKTEKLSSSFIQLSKPKPKVESFASKVSNSISLALAWSQSLVAARESLVAGLRSAEAERFTRVDDDIEKRLRMLDHQLASPHTINRYTTNDSYRSEIESRRTRAGQIRKALVDASLQPYLSPIANELQKAETSTPEVVEAAYRAYLEQQPSYSTSPSFYLYCSRLFFAAGAGTDIAMRIVANCLEINIQDVQMFRCAAYFMLEIGAFEEAIALFRRVQDKAPAEPQSFIDLGLALFFLARRQWDRNHNLDEVRPIMTECISNLADAMLGKWVSRFYEIEWIIQIWLNWAVAFSKFIGLGDLWPANVTRVFQVSRLRLDFVVSMGWDTDHTDIDLHVFESDGSHVYYGNRTSHNGGLNSRDFTDGYGPECYIIKNAPMGIYKIRARYYSCHQSSSTTGTTSVVLWTVKNFGDFRAEQFTFQSIRLERNQSELEVAFIDLAE